MSAIRTMVGVVTMLCFMWNRKLHQDQGLHWWNDWRSRLFGSSDGDGRMRSISMQSI